MRGIGSPRGSKGVLYFCAERNASFPIPPPFHFRLIRSFASHPMLPWLVGFIIVVVSLLRWLCARKPQLSRDAHKVVALEQQLKFQEAQLIAARRETQSLLAKLAAAAETAEKRIRDEQATTHQPTKAEGTATAQSVDLETWQENGRGTSLCSTTTSDTPSSAPEPSSGSQL